MRDVLLRVSKRQSMKMAGRIQQLAEAVAKLILEVPPFDPKWTVSRGPHQEELGANSGLPEVPYKLTDGKGDK